MKRTLLSLALLSLAACDAPGTDDAQAGKPETAATTQSASVQVATSPDAAVAKPAGRTASPSVSYEGIPSAGTLPPPAGTLANPFSADPGAIQQGQMLFAAMNCAGCHGGGAVGFVGPSLVDGRWRYGGDDGALFHSIFYGRPHGMPAYGGLLNEATVWQLITYLRSQPVPSVVPTMAWQ